MPKLVLITEVLATMQGRHTRTTTPKAFIRKILHQKVRPR